MLQRNNVILNVEFGEEDEEEYSMAPDPPGKHNRVITLGEEKLESMSEDPDELNEL